MIEIGQMISNFDAKQDEDKICDGIKNKKPPFF
jgi:hypothetical protein